MTETRSRHWEIQPKVDSFTFGLFTECIADIAESVRLINEMCLHGQLNAPSFIRAARNISVVIRKVMFDGSGYLFKECVKPCLHPLKDPNVRPRKGLLSDVLVERHEGMSIGYTVGESEAQKTFAAPAYEHRTVVNPLYGLRRIAKEAYQLDDLFDLAGEPMKYSRWMNLKILQVGEAVLAVKDILRLLATYEGAHLESNQMTRMNPSLPVDIKLPDHNDELYRKGTWITFGGVSYLHIFTLLVGVYLVNVMKETLKHVPEVAGEGLHRTHLSDAILQSPSRIKPPALQLKKAFNTGVVLQSTDDSFELVGDYGRLGITRIRIPGWR